MNTTLTPTERERDDWDEFLPRARLFRVTSPDRVFFDVLLLGQADYVAVNINERGEYDPNAELRLYSVNGEFRMWVEDGMRGPIRGVRWALPKRGNRWDLALDTLARLAIELVMGEHTDDRGNVV